MNSTYDLIFENGCCIYTKMQVIIWASSGLALPYMIEDKAGTLLTEIYSEYKPEQPLAVDFDGIKLLDLHALDNFIEAVKVNKRQLIFLNISDIYHINQENYKGLYDLLKQNSLDFEYVSKTQSIYINSDSQEFGSDSIHSEFEKIIYNQMKIFVKNSFITYSNPKRLSSTPIYATGEFNSRRLISSRQQFVWITIGLCELLDKVLKTINLSNQILPLKLLTVSLRSSPFAAALGLIKGIKFDTIDHLGPRHKLFDVDFLDRPIQSVRYIYIGDFTIGGSEIKIAKTYSQILGAKLDHAIVIGSLLNKDVFSKEFDINYLFELEKLHPDAKYNI